MVMVMAVDLAVELMVPMEMLIPEMVVTVVDTQRPVVRLEMVVRV
jgi:hypothetical protein